MNIKEVIEKYFNAWIDNNIDIVNQTFSDEVVYSECNGPVYEGKEQIKKWFYEWNLKGKVQKWDIKRISVCDNNAFVEWYFKCVYENVVYDFDGVTVVDFDSNNKIIKLSEYQSDTKHIYPYREK